MFSRCVIFFLTVYLSCTLGGLPVRSSGRTGHSRDLAIDRKLKSGSGVSHQVGGLITEVFGDSVSSRIWPGFNKEGGGPVSKENQLDCGFESECCWANVASGDQLDWALFEGDFNESLISIGNGTKPSGKWLAVMSNGARSKTHDAHFGSCSIACAQDDVQVSLKYWTTAGVKLSLCTRSALLDKEKGSLENCKDLSADSSFATVTFPTGRKEVFDVVVVAKNFANTGSAGIIDDIAVTYKPCKHLTTATKAQSNSTEDTPAKVAFASKEECKQVTCDFENDDACSYVDNSVLNDQQPANDSFQVRMGRFKNPITGITRAGDGIHYIAAYLKHGAVAKLETTVAFSEDRVVRFQHFEATAGILMKGCCDGDDNCPFQTNPEVDPSDLKWSTASFQCPAGTKKILFICMNDLFNEGACGVDSIELFGGSPDPDAAVYNLCQSQ